MEVGWRSDRGSLPGEEVGGCLGVDAAPGVLAGGMEALHHCVQVGGYVGAGAAPAVRVGMLKLWQSQPLIGQVLALLQAQHLCTHKCKCIMHYTPSLSSLYDVRCSVGKVLVSQCSDQGLVPGRITWTK